MADEQIQKILGQLEDHERRIITLEKGKGEPSPQATNFDGSKKTLTLAEIVRGKSFRSGQEKVAVIVGYCEKVVHKNPIKESDLKQGWKEGKFDGKYANTLLLRAIKDGLVRDIGGDFDLSQTGEEFFDNFFKSNA